jgi:alkanesulfonate monooxygenase SsuD/methylene tetrahydromethanopterin reductase-like flavin-dependent oxidoreductase (luciferase family)
VDDDPAAARRTVRPALEFFGEPDWAVHIDPLPFAAELRALRASCADRAEFTRRMPDEWVDQLTIVGPPDDVRAHLDTLHAAGVTTAVLMPAGPDSLAALDGLGRIL